MANPILSMDLFQLLSFVRDRRIFIYVYAMNLMFCSFHNIIFIEVGFYMFKRESITDYRVLNPIIYSDLRINKNAGSGGLYFFFRQQKNYLSSKKSLRTTKQEQIASIRVT